MSNDKDRPSFSDLLFAPGKLFGRTTIEETPALVTLPGPANTASPALDGTPTVTAPPAPPPSSPTASATALLHPISRWYLWSDTTTALVVSLPASTNIGSIYLPNLKKVPAGTVNLFAGQSANPPPFYAAQYEAETVRIASAVPIVTITADPVTNYGPLYVFVTEERLDPFASAPSDGGLSFDALAPYFPGLLHFWAMSEPGPQAQPPAQSTLARDTPSLGQPSFPMITSAHPDGYVSLQGGRSLTKDGGASALLNAYSRAAQTYHFGVDVNNGAFTGGVALNWPATPTGDFTVTFYGLVPSTYADIPNKAGQFDHSLQYHSLLTSGNGASRPKLGGTDDGGSDSVASGFAIYADVSGLAEKQCCIRLSCRDAGRASNPAGYDDVCGEPISAGFSWITAPPMNDFGSSDVGYDVPFFVAVTYESASKTFALFVNAQNPIPGDAAAINPIFDRGCTIGSDDFSNLTGTICYMSKVALYETVLPVALIELLANERLLQ